MYNNRIHLTPGTAALLAKSSVNSKEIRDMQIMIDKCPGG